MRPLAATCSLAALMGCNAVFQLEHVDDPRIVRGNIGTIHAEPVGDGTYARVDTAPTFGVEMSLFADGDAHDVPVSTAGDFLFLPATERYRLGVRTDFDAFVVEYQQTASELTLRRIFYDRFLDRAPVTALTPVSFNLESGSTTGFVAIASTGVRSFTSFPGTTPVAMPSVNWPLATFVEGTPGLLDASLGDRLYWLHFELNGSMPIDYYRATEQHAAAVTMVSGQPLVVPETGFGVRQPLSADRCVHLVVPRFQELARVRTELGHLTFGQTKEYTQWDFGATPNLALGPGKTLQVAYASGLSTLEEVSPVRYSFPFEGEHTVVRMQSYVFRTFTAPGATRPTSPELAMGTTTHVPILEHDCANPPRVEIPIGVSSVARTFTLGGIDITTDGQPVTIEREQVIELALGFGSGTHNDVSVILYEVQKVGPASDSDTSLEPIRQWVTPFDTIEVDPALFVRGRAYTFLVNTRIDSAGTVTGDYSQFAYPYLRGRSWSPMFIAD